MAVRTSRGWRPVPLSDSDVVDLAESGATRWELTPDQIDPDANRPPPRSAPLVNVWNLAALDAGLLCLFVLFSFPSNAGTTPIAPSGNWADLSAIGYYLGELLGLAGSGALLALADPGRLLLFALIMGMQLMSVGMISPRHERASLTR